MTAPVAPDQPVEPVQPDPVAPEAIEPEAELPTWAKEKLAKANREAANLRARLKETEPLAQEAAAAREAAKTSEQRAIERAEALEAELAQERVKSETNGLAAQYGIPSTHFRYIVGTSPEERADAAAGIADLLKAQATPQITAPPSNRTVENLRPGASPAEPDNTPPTAYPAWWIQKPRQG